jgi:hypothetical protein
MCGVTPAIVLHQPLYAHSLPTLVAGGSVQCQPRPPSSATCEAVAKTVKLLLQMEA